MATSYKRTNIYLTEDQRQKLSETALSRHISISKLLRAAALEIIDDEQDIREGQKALPGAKGSISWSEYKKLR
jgi:hypothetical protein